MSTTNKGHAEFRAYLDDCDKHAIVPDVGGAFNGGWKAGRASLAANAPAAEPVACNVNGTWLWIKLMDWCKKRGSAPADYNDLFLIAREAHARYTAPPAPTEQWMSVAERLPEPGKAVLLDIGRQTPIRAMWAAKHTVEAGDDDTDWADYDEEGDMYYSPEGWYEWNEHEETHWAVTGNALNWCEIPAPPQGAAKVAM